MDTIMLYEKIITIESGLATREDKLQERETLHQEIAHYAPDSDELKVARAKLIEIDHALDEFEEDSEETIRELEASLAEQLIEEAPEEAKGYHDPLSHVQRAEEVLGSLSRIEEGLLELEVPLKMAIKARNWVKKRGVLGYIFGPNPNLVINEQLEHIANQSEKLLIAAKDESEVLARDEETKAMAVQLATFLQTIKIDAKKSWSYRSFDAAFFPAQETLTALLKIGEALQNTMTDKVVAGRSSIRQWIESNIKRR